MASKITNVKTVIDNQSNSLLKIDKKNIDYIDNLWPKNILAGISRAMEVSKKQL